MLQRGKAGQLFGSLESSYGTPPTIAVTHFLRHISANFDYDVKNKRYSPEKKNGPGRFARFDDRETAGFMVEALLRPSGTLNTVAECGFILEAAMGAKNNITLSTTVNVTSSVSGATLTSAAGLVAKTTGLQITCPDGKLRLRRVATLAGAVVTWTPDLPAGQAPANGAAIKAVNCYYLTKANALSLWFARYNFQADGTSGLNEIIKGGMADRLSITGGFNEEVRLSVSGPAKTKADAATHPGTPTQVGTNPASGNDSEIVIDNTTAKYLKLGIEMTNGLIVRTDENNVTAASEGYRMGDRDITLAFDQNAENAQKTAIYDKSMACTEVGFHWQVGLTSSGKLFAVTGPRLELKPPTVNSGDAAVQLPYKGTFLETVEDSDDEIVVMLG